MSEAGRRERHFLDDGTTPALPEDWDQATRERYVLRQLIWALVGLGLFLLATVWFDGRASAAADEPTAALFAPRSDLAAALDEARRSGRTGVAVLFEMDGCGECARLKAGPFSDPAVRSAYRDAFVPLALHADAPLPMRDFDGREVRQDAFATRERVFALPTLVFYDLDGLPVTRQVGSALPAADWVRLAAYVRERRFETAPFAPSGVAVGG